MLWNDDEDATIRNESALRFARAATANVRSLRLVVVETMQNSDTFAVNDAGLLENPKRAVVALETARILIQKGMGDISMIKWPKTPAEKEEHIRDHALVVADRLLKLLNVRPATPTRDEIADVLTIRVPGSAP
jgi:hypothetical protein